MSTLPSSETPSVSDNGESLHVCLINDSFPPAIDGVSNAVTNYARIIARDYGEATVVTPYYPKADDSVYPFPVIRYPSVDVTRLVGYRAGLPFSPEIAARLEKSQFDIIHSHCPITSTMLARSVRERLDVPLVFTYHTKFDIDIANAIRLKILRGEAAKILAENISACDEVWTVSNGAGENLRKLGYQGDYLVMPNGVDFPTGRVPDGLVRAVTEGFDLPVSGWCLSAAARTRRKSSPTAGSSAWTESCSSVNRSRTATAYGPGTAGRTCSSSPRPSIPTAWLSARRRPAASAASWSGAAVHPRV